MHDLELLERERELQVLEALADAACHGAGRLVTVEGAAGIGKTRLLAVARAQAQRSGMRVLLARGSELEQTFAYGVVRQLFEPVLASADHAGRDELLAGAAAQSSVLFDQADAGAAEGDISFALLHGLYWLTANLAQHPLLLVVDDLHWADAPSLRFLAYLMPRLEGLALLVVVGLRPAESAADQHLLAQITTDPLATMVRPAPLSAQASAQLVRGVLDATAEDEFCLACHTATGGNPLLLRELADTAAAEGLAATAAGAVRLSEIGPQALKRRVALRLARLDPSAAALCGALAVLGDGADPAHVSVLAGLDPAEALQATRRLIDIEILQRGSPTPADRPGTEVIGFVHPLVRAAVYDGLAQAARLTGHARAARLLADGGEDAERVAAHLLLIPPAGDDFVTATLRRAADQAFARGSPDSAVSYLGRCLQEPPPDLQRVDVLFQLGVATQLLCAARSAEYMIAALEATEDTGYRVLITEALGLNLFNAGRVAEAGEVIAQAIGTLDGEHPDLQQRLQALLIHTMLIDPARRQDSAATVGALRDAPPDTGLGSRALDVTIAFHDLLAGTDPDSAVALARRGLADGSLIEQTNTLAVYGCSVLLSADLPEVIPLLDAWIAVAHRRGSVSALAPAKCFRGVAWLWSGALVEAEANLRDALWATTTTSQQIGVPVMTSYLAEVLMEQGNLDEAEKVLGQAGPSQQLPSTGYWAWLLSSRARLLTLRGRIEEGLQTWLACGHRFTAHGGQNPAVVSWRSGAALAMHHLGRVDEARELADQEITLARRWGAPTTIGRALRVAGLVQPDQGGLALLQEAATVIASSPARLDHAKILIDLGAALRRSGRRNEARAQLRRGVELAYVCGATPLVRHGWTELRASGARPRHTVPSGPGALTPSERRVAELAAAGNSNRDIAQTLFITTNTVEVHLTRVYRKLAISGRSDLPGFSLDPP